MTGAFSRWAPPLPRDRKRRSTLWFLVPLLILLLVWAALSDNPGAQELQRMANLSHSETILPDSFSVKPQTFSYYRFAVPSGARGVSVTGDFATDNGSSKDGEVEVYLLTEGDLVNWQYGYSPGAFYTSGRVAHGQIEAMLPSGPGTYCLVFNNNFSPHATKAVHASATLHYKKWWPLR